MPVRTFTAAVLLMQLNTHVDTTVNQLRGESATKSPLHPGPEPAHTEKVKLYRTVMEALRPLLGLDTGEKADEELGLIRQLIDVLTAERVRLDEIKKKRERGEVTERKERLGY